VQHILPEGMKNFVGASPPAPPWLRAWWERRSHIKHKERLIHLQEFPHWIFLFPFSAAVLYTRQLVIYSFMLLQTLHLTT